MGLRQHLGRQDAKGESGVDQLGGQFRGHGLAALDDRAEPDLGGIFSAVFQGGEDPPVIQVGDVDGVASGAELAGEVADAPGEPLRVVEQQHFSHVIPVKSLRPGGPAATTIPWIPDIYWRQLARS